MQSNECEANYPHRETPVAVIWSREHK